VLWHAGHTKASFHEKLHNKERPRPNGLLPNKDVYGLFEGRFGDGSAAALAAFALYIKKDVQRRQGLVLDIRVKPHEVVKCRVVEEMAVRAQAQADQPDPAVLPGARVGKPEQRGEPSRGPRRPRLPQEAS